MASASPFLRANTESSIVPNPTYSDNERSGQDSIAPSPADLN